MRLAQKHMRDQRPDDVRVVRPRLRRRSSRRSTPARCSSTSACCRRRRPANCRPATGETIGKAKACWAGGARADLPQPRRPRPAPAAGFTQVAAADEAATVTRIKAAFLALKDPNDWTGDGQPEGWKVIDRVFTKAEARYIPNGAGQHGRHGAPDAHRRPRRVLLPAVPVRRRDAGHADRPVGVLRPARLRARRAGPQEQHQHARHVPRRRRRPSSAGSSRDVRSIDLAPTAAFLLDIPVPQQSQGVVRLDMLDDGQSTRRSTIVGLNDFHGQLDPTTTHVRRRSTRPSVGGAGAAGDDVRRGGRGAARPVAAAGGGRQRRRLAAELGAARGQAGDRRRERVGARRHQLRQPRVRLRRRTHPRSIRRGPTSRSSPPTSSRRRPARHPTGWSRRRSSASTASRSA